VEKWVGRVCQKFVERPGILPFANVLCAVPAYWFAAETGEHQAPSKQAHPGHSEAYLSLVCFVMASKPVAEGGLEPAVAAPMTLLADVLGEGLAAVKVRGYAILEMSPACFSAMNRLRASQSHFFGLPREEKKKYAQCHAVNTHGISEVSDLKYYFQARSGGKGAGLPFPGRYDFSSDFGVDILDVYTQLDLLGRACLLELAPSLGVPLCRIVDILDPLGAKRVAMETLTKEQILALDFPSVREEGEGTTVYSELLPDGYVSSSNLDLFFYHNNETTRSKWALNHPTHTDSGIISFIPVSAVPALDFFDQKLNAWIEIERAVHEQAGALGKTYQQFVIAMAGDTLEQLAKNTFKAGLHRVVRTQETRESAVYKLRARPELVGPKYEVDYKIVQIQRKALGLPDL